MFFDVIRFYIIANRAAFVNLVFHRGCVFGCSCPFASFPPSSRSRVVQHWGGAPEIECYARSDSAIMKIDESSSELSIYKTLIQTTLDYATLVHKSKISAEYPPVIRRCIQYIASHTHQNISLDELAEGSGYSKEYIAKLFRKHVGLPIGEHIQMVRIEEAKSLLRQGKSSGEVAYILNYTSQSYFTRQFKKQTGMTPMVYHNMLKLDPSI